MGVLRGGEELEEREVGGIVRAKPLDITEYGGLQPAGPSGRLGADGDGSGDWPCALRALRPQSDVRAGQPTDPGRRDPRFRAEPHRLLEVLEHPHRVEALGGAQPPGGAADYGHAAPPDRQLRVLQAVR